MRAKPEGSGKTSPRRGSTKKEEGGAKREKKKEGKMGEEVRGRNRLFRDSTPEKSRQKKKKGGCIEGGVPSDQRGVN